MAESRFLVRLLQLGGQSSTSANLQPAHGRGLLPGMEWRVHTLLLAPFFAA